MAIVLAAVRSMSKYDGDRLGTAKKLALGQSAASPWKGSCNCAGGAVAAIASR